MPVTELARLQVLSRQDQNDSNSNNDNNNTVAGQSVVIDPSLLADLKFAQDVLTKSSAHQFQLYQSVDRHETLYIVGSWDSVAFHRQVFLPSSENQHLLQTLQGRVNVDFMFHLDIDQSETPILSAPPSSSSSSSATIAAAAVVAGTGTGTGTTDSSGVQTRSLAIIRHFLSSGQDRSDFERQFHDSISKLRSTNEQLIVAGDWRIDESEPSNTTQSGNTQGDHEFVLFVSSSADPDSGPALDLYARRMQSCCCRPLEIARVTPLQY